MENKLKWFGRFLGGLGLFLVVKVMNWEMGIGIFLMMWGNNLVNKYGREI